MNVTNVNLLMNTNLIEKEKKNIRFYGADSVFDKKMEKNHDLEIYFVKAKKLAKRLVVCIL